MGCPGCPRPGLKDTKVPELEAAAFAEFGNDLIEEAVNDGFDQRIQPSTITG